MHGMAYDKVTARYFDRVYSMIGDEFGALLRSRLARVFPRFVVWHPSYQITPCQIPAYEQKPTSMIVTVGQYYSRIQKTRAIRTRAVLPRHFGS